MGKMPMPRRTRTSPGIASQGGQPHLPPCETPRSPGLPDSDCPCTRTQARADQQWSLAIQHAGQRAAVVWGEGGEGRLDRGQDSASCVCSTVPLHFIFTSKMKVLRISRWQQQSIKPSVGPSAPATAHEAPGQRFTGCRAHSHPCLYSEVY